MLALRNSELAVQGSFSKHNLNPHALMTAQSGNHQGVFPTAHYFEDVSNLVLIPEYLRNGRMSSVLLPQLSPREAGIVSPGYLHIAVPQDIG